VNPRFKIEADVIGGLSGESNSTRFSNFGVNEPITGLSIKDLPDIKNFAGFVGKIVPLDQDMDGLPDYEEVALGTDKTKADTDGDGLTDKEEVELGTDPLKSDTDGDGYSDLAEVNASTNPKDAQSNPNRAPTNLYTTSPLTLAENQPVGTVVGNFKGTDPDTSAVLRFYLAPISQFPHNSLFSLDLNGTLSSQVMFDFESNASTYSIRVEVRDEYNATLAKTFSVSLTNVIEDLDGDGIEDADDPDTDGDGFSDEDELADGKDPLDPLSNPNRKPSLVNITSFSIRENKPIGSTVGTLQANDANWDPLTFSLQTISGSIDHQSFTLGNDGVLKTKVSFDYESKNKYILQAEVSDGRGGLTSMQFEILVTNDFLDDTDVIGMMDDDEDGLSNDAEKELGTNPNKADSDGDGLNDRDEIIFGSNPLQPDTDGDSLNDQQEYSLGSDPNQKDTDGDGYDDQSEHTAGTLLEDRFDYPGSKDSRSDPNTKTDSPDGLLYQIHFAEKGLPLNKAKRLAGRLNGKIAEIAEDDSVLKNYLVALMAKENVETESDSLGLMGVWIQSKEEPDATTMMDVDGDLYIDEVEPEDRLAVILAFEIPDIYQPMVQTTAVIPKGDTFVVEAGIVEDGGETAFRYGFEITESLLVTDSAQKRIVSGNMIKGTNQFRATIDRLTPGITYYIRPFAENSAGLTRGDFKRLKLESGYDAPFDAVESGDGNWMTSSWFGSFHRANDNWIYHAELEWWVYVANEAGFGQWFWTEKLGWCWTAQSVYPFIWKHASGSWLFKMDIIRQGKSVFWNYATGETEFH
jgi:hypothetical protein